VAISDNRDEKAKGMGKLQAGGCERRCSAEDEIGGLGAKRRLQTTTAHVGICSCVCVLTYVLFSLSLCVVILQNGIAAGPTFYIPDSPYLHHAITLNNTTALLCLPWDLLPPHSS